MQEVPIGIEKEKDRIIDLTHMLESAIEGIDRQIVYFLKNMLLAATSNQISTYALQVRNLSNALSYLKGKGRRPTKRNKKLSVRFAIPEKIEMDTEPDPSANSASSANAASVSTSVSSPTLVPSPPTTPALSTHASTAAVPNAVSTLVSTTAATTPATATAPTNTATKQQQWVTPTLDVTTKPRSNSLKQQKKGSLLVLPDFSSLPPPPTPSATPNVSASISVHPTTSLTANVAVNPSASVTLSASVNASSASMNPTVSVSASASVSGQEQEKQGSRIMPQRPQQKSEDSFIMEQLLANIAQETQNLKDSTDDSSIQQQRSSKEVQLPVKEYTFEGKPTTRSPSATWSARDRHKRPSIPSFDSPTGSRDDNAASRDSREIYAAKPLPVPPQMMRRIESQQRPEPIKLRAHTEMSLKNSLPAKKNSEPPVKFTFEVQKKKSEQPIKNSAVYAPPPQRTQPRANSFGPSAIQSATAAYVQNKNFNNKPNVSSVKQMSQSFEKKQ
jgi:hypothetical protein